jgi:hypothetical protein
MGKRVSSAWYLCAPENLPGPDSVNAGFQIYQYCRDVLENQVKHQRQSLIPDSSLKRYYIAAEELAFHEQIVRMLHCILGLQPGRVSEQSVSDLRDCDAKMELQEIRKSKKGTQLLRAKEAALRELKDGNYPTPEPLPCIYDPNYPATKEQLDWEFYYTHLTGPPVLEWRKAYALRKNSNEHRGKFYRDQATYAKVNDLKALYTDKPMPDNVTGAMQELEVLLEFKFDVDIQ